MAGKCDHDSVLLAAQTYDPTTNYSYDIVARSGSSFVGFVDNPSIEDSGTVTFVGQSSTGEAIFFSKVGATPIAASFSPSHNRFYGRAVQINKSGRLLGNDRVSGAPPIYFEHVWDSNNPGAYKLLAKSGGSNPAYDTP